MRVEDITSVGVVGVGTMGFGIALNFALAGFTTRINDVSEDVVKGALGRMEAALRLMREEGLVTAARAKKALGKVAVSDLDGLAAKSDFITEVIVERSADKKALFNRLDKLCPPHTILASNTSWLTLSDFGSEVVRQDRLVITHYFAPAHLVPGVEVVRSPRTSDESYDLACGLMKAIGKVPIRVLQERPGSLINRIQDAMRHEANKLWPKALPAQRISSVASPPPLVFAVCMKVRCFISTSPGCGVGRATSVRESPTPRSTVSPASPARPETESGASTLMARPGS